MPPCEDCHIADIVTLQTLLRLRKTGPAENRANGMCFIAIQSRYHTSKRASCKRNSCVARQQRHRDRCILTDGTADRDDEKLLMDDCQRGYEKAKQRVQGLRI